MKTLFVGYLFLLVCLLSFNPSQASEYISTNSLAIIDDRAYLIEQSNGTSSLIEYNFPELVELKKLALDSNFSYANAGSSGVAIYNYNYDVQVDKPSEESSTRTYYKDVYEIKTYNLNLEFIATKTIENQYYYDFVIDPSVEAAPGAVENKCGKKGKKKGACSKVTSPSL